MAELQIIEAAAGQIDRAFQRRRRIRPKLRMQLGEVQLWRIVNSSSRSAA